MISGQANVTFNMATGAIEGAGPVQYAGMRAMALAAKTLRPFGVFGFSYVAKLLRTLLPADKTVVVDYQDDSLFQFPYGDAYWSVLLDRNHIYEEEVKVFLLAISGIDYAFLDCGANYGYWSVHVTSEKFGSHRSVAIEADADTFAILRENCSRNSERFKVMRKAVSRTDGEVVTIYGKKHEARSIVKSESAPARDTVDTICLDTVAEAEDLFSSDCIVLKLDVEGVEVEALKGAQKLLERDVIVVYEDHGSDRDHQVTQYLMNEAGMQTYGYHNGRFFNLTSPKQLDALKTDRRRGYDFFATKSDFWRGKMSELVG